MPDLWVASPFYEDVLGCACGHDAGNWRDVLLFGHQLTLHQATPQHPSRPIDHFGVVLNKSQWYALIEWLEGSVSTS